MKPLTKKQAAVLDAIKYYIEDLGYPPTVRELQNQLCYKSPASIHRILVLLEERGRISRKSGKNRTINII